MEMKELTFSHDGSILMRISKKTYLFQLQNGNIRMNRVGVFRENNKMARDVADPNEGFVQAIEASKIIWYRATLSFYRATLCKMI